ncbi:MAG: triose-phosphate isomerase [Solirubrobacterales bacterium]
MPDSRRPRRSLVAGNWKMNDPGAAGYVADLAGRLGNRSRNAQEADVWVCPPFTALADAVSAAGNSGIEIAAQNMHAEHSGAFTGEVSAPMLTALGVSGVILGHSERRELLGETDDALAAKLPAALASGLVPILCVGETEAEREDGNTERKLRHQLEADLKRVSGRQLPEVVVAYEPIWAIGTGKTATAQQTQDAISFVRSLLAARDAAAATQVRILYGGSVNADNAAELLALPDIDGALVGGASLDPGQFAQIVAAAGPGR